MARIDISRPYEDYLESLVKAGHFRSITSAAEAAIRKQMVEDEKMRLLSIDAALAKGEADIRNGRKVIYTAGLMSEISEKGKKAAIEGEYVKKDVRP